jgi:hypothetical protein
MSGVNIGVYDGFGSLGSDIDTENIDTENKFGSGGPDGFPGTTMRCICIYLY